jgi:hypothetical protein
MHIYTNLMKFKFKCIKRSRFEKLFFTRLLKIHSSFLHIFLEVFHIFKKFKNHLFLISPILTTFTEFQQNLSKF